MVKKQAEWVPGPSHYKKPELLLMTNTIVDKKNRETEAAELMRRKKK